MKRRRSTRRKVERAIKDAEGDKAEGLAGDREHKVYGPSIDFDRLPMPEDARETVKEWPGTAHLTEDREDAEEAMEDAARVIGWGETHSREGDGDGEGAVEDGTRE